MEAAEQVAHVVLPEADDVVIVGGALTGLEWNTFVTAVFSAKESIYKCVRPLVDEFFGFDDVHLVSVDPDERLLRMRVARALGAGFSEGTELVSRFTIDGAYVHTITVLERIPARGAESCT
jgi:enterobactin synthetase component D